MILPVFLYGQAVLRQKAEDVAKDYPEIKKLVADMYDTMYHADGVGLAAPQIGLSIRLLVIDANVYILFQTAKLFRHYFYVIQHILFRRLTNNRTINDSHFRKIRLFFRYRSYSTSCLSVDKWNPSCAK